jgi:hypothetical protein
MSNNDEPQEQTNPTHLFSRKPKNKAVSGFTYLPKEFYTVPGCPPNCPRIFLFDQQDSEENILFANEDKETGISLIKAATIEKLIERATTEKYADPSFLLIFLLTYRSFMTPEDLLNGLIQRFKISPPSNATPEEHEDFEKTVQFPIRLRVCNFLKTWVSNYYYDFEEDVKLQQQFNTFVTTTLVKLGMTNVSKSIQLAFSKKSFNLFLLKNRAVIEKPQR